MKKPTLNAVHNGALRQLLQERGLLAAFEDGELTCTICGRRVGWDNLLAVFMENDHIQFVCNEYRCYDELRSRRTHAMA